MCVLLSDTVVVQSPAGRFMLNGEEIDLGVGPQASMAHRVEALRVLLEQRLGFDTFMKYAPSTCEQPSRLHACWLWLIRVLQLWAGSELAAQML